MAIKGKVCIELHNTITGEDRKIEGDNMVTNAIADYLNWLHDMKIFPVSSKDNPFLSQLPVATRLLGGLLIFSDALTEDATKFTIPNNKKILGYASNDSDNATISRGSYNSEESGQISTGYKHVWDFATSQCNGVISALSLTHREATKDMVNIRCYYDETSGQDLRLFRGMGDANYKAPLIQKNEYLYYATYVGNAAGTIKEIRIYKVINRLSDFKVADYVIGTDETVYPSELVTSISITDFPAGMSSQTVSSFTYTTDGKDYAYVAYIKNASGLIDYGKDINVVKIDLSDFTYTTKTITFPQNVYYRVYVSPDGTAFAHRASSGGTSYDTFYAYDLSTDNITTITTPETVATAQYGLTEYGLLYAYNSTSVGWLIYPDGTMVNLKNIPVGNAKPYIPFMSGKLLTGTATSGQAGIYFNLSNKYLGTIFNLSSAITKTAADTMKIIYTLTDA